MLIRHDQSNSISGRIAGEIAFADWLDGRADSAESICGLIDRFLIGKYEGIPVQSRAVPGSIRDACPLPGVHRDMMVVAPRRQERRLRVIADDVEAEPPRIKLLRRLKIAHMQMDVSHHRLFRQSGPGRIAFGQKPRTSTDRSPWFQVHSDGGVVIHFDTLSFRIGNTSVSLTAWSALPIG